MPLQEIEELLLEGYRSVMFSLLLDVLLHLAQANDPAMCILLPCVAAFGASLVVSVLPLSTGCARLPVARILDPFGA